MEKNSTISAQRLHIGFFGRRNAGKSSLVNAVTGQAMSVVSDVKGTTTDPVKKSMELLPLGPVVIIDTPGLDDEGELGRLRVQRAKQILNRADIAVLVLDGSLGLCRQDKELLQMIKEKALPYLVVYHKADLLETRKPLGDKELYASAVTGEGIKEIKEALGTCAESIKPSKTLIADKLKEGDLVVLVTPIDESAPKGRLILPQQMTIREILDVHGIVVTCQDTELETVLKKLGCQPKLVITDSQVFQSVSKIVPADIPLTSFSILMAQYKGELEELLKGAAALSELKDGDKVLICEGCTHHRQCNDIGTVKMPGWITAYAKAKLQFGFTAGGDFPEDVSPYKLVVHCGGCMLNETEMKHRIAECVQAKVPIVNYGMAIAKMHGILGRSVDFL